MNRIAVLSVGRSDYGLYRPILNRLSASEHWDPILIVSGSHLSKEFGETVAEIEKDRLKIGAKVPVLGDSDSQEAVSKSIGAGVIGFAGAFADLKPDLLMVLGDRFEMMAGALAALPFRIPVAHIHGGELSQGAIDDALRHSITKLSHLHFVSTREYGNRVIQLGEEPWRVHVSGAPGLDAIAAISPMSRDEFRAAFGIELPDQFLLATYHPTTLGAVSPSEEIQVVLEGLSRTGLPVLFTLPNEDAGGLEIRRKIVNAVEANQSWWAIDSLGSRGYFTAMSLASSMVGNSSSGIIEAKSFQLPVVNIGTRQEGRIRPPNVIDVDVDSTLISKAISKAVDGMFRNEWIDTPNPYGNGNAAEVIGSTLEALNITPKLTVKRFHDVRVP